MLRHKVTTVLQETKVEMKKLFILALLMIVGMTTGIYLSRYTVPFLPDTDRSFIRISNSIVVTLRQRPDRLIAPHDTSMLKRFQVPARTFETRWLFPPFEQGKNLDDANPSRIVST
jgi:hypothetical protein